MPRFNCVVSAIVGVGVMSWSLTAVAGVATDGQTAPAGATTFTPTYAPSSSDLINGLTPTAQAGNFALEASGGVGILTDGAYGSIGTGATGAHPAFATGGPGGGTSLTYGLDLAAHPAGYDISSIVSYGGWNDAGRDQQSYSVSYSTVAAPSVFLPIATVNYNPDNPLNTPSATRVTITPDTGPALGTGVAAVQFTFTNAVENGYTGYAELDVFGKPTVPEPASVSILGIGALGLLTRRRRA